MRQAGHPDAEQTSAYLPVHTTFAGAKQQEIDAKIAELRDSGWTFVRIAKPSERTDSRSMKAPPAPTQ